MAARPNVQDLFDNVKATQMYKKIEHFTGAYAQDLIDLSGIVAQASTSPSHKLTILDMACGTAVVSSLLMSSLPKGTGIELVCADNADAMVATADARIVANGWPGKAIKADAQDTKLPDEEFTHVFFNFGPGLIPDAHKGIKECHRMLKLGGKLGCTSWIDVGWLPDVQECFVQHEELPRLPNVEELFTAISKDGTMWRDPGVVKRMFLEGNGFGDVRIEVVDREMVFDGGYQAVMESLSMILGMLFTLWFSPEEKKEYMGRAMGYMEEFLRMKYGEEGKVVWRFKALVAIATKPE